MSAPIAIRVVDLVGPICVSTDDGQRIYDTIAPLLRTGRPVALSFAGITTVIAAFLNVAIGQLYGEFSDAHIRTHISVSDLDAQDTALLHRVVENAKVYFAAPTRFAQAWAEETSDET